MIKWLIHIIWGDTCKHDWQEIATTNHTAYRTHLFVCKKCGKFKSIDS